MHPRALAGCGCSWPHGCFTAWECWHGMFFKTLSSLAFAVHPDMSVSHLAGLTHTDRILQPQRAGADRNMLGVMAFLALTGLGVGFYTDTTALALAVALPAWVVPALIYRAAPGSLASRMAIAM